MRESEIAQSLVFGHFGVRKKLCVPNTTCFLPWEADLLVMTPRGYIDEVEIKVSRQDFLREFVDKADKHKVLSGQSQRWHRTAQLVSRFWFAVPVEMEAFAMENLPAYAGLLVVDLDMSLRRQTKVAWPAPKRSSVRPATQEEMYKLARLGTIRYWATARSKRR